jgi:hypothetical protein
MLKHTQKLIDFIDMAERRDLPAGLYAAAASAAALLTEEQARNVLRYLAEDGWMDEPVVRVGCRERVCTCHDDSAWTDPAAYPTGCSHCGCIREESC